MAVLNEKYTTDKARALITDRYKNMEGRIPFTIKLLEKDKGFQQTFKDLKAKGYADWVIYMAILNLIANYRVSPEARRSLDKDAMIREMKKTIEGVETKDAITIPPEELNEKNLEMAIDLGMMSSLKIFGFDSRKRTPNLKNIRKFLAKKYNYFAEDMPHKKWFKFEEQ